MLCTGSSVQVDSTALVLGQEDLLVVLTSCIICVIKSEPAIVDQLISFGFIQVRVNHSLNYFKRLISLRKSENGREFAASAGCEQEGIAYHFKYNYWMLITSTYFLLFLYHISWHFSKRLNIVSKLHRFCELIVFLFKSYSDFAWGGESTWHSGQAGYWENRPRFLPDEVSQLYRSGNC